MEEKQQAMSIKTTDETSSMSLEQDLINFVQKAQEKGWAQNRAMELLRKYWKECRLAKRELPEENEEEKNFRKKVKLFMDKNYGDFDYFAYKLNFVPNRYRRYEWYTDGYDRWNDLEYSTFAGRRREVLDDQSKKNLIMEVCCSIYNVYAEKVNMVELKNVTSEKIEIMFPDFRNPKGRVSLVLAMLFEYVDQYKLDWWSDVTNVTKEDYEKNLILKFVRMIEDFEVFNH